MGLAVVVALGGVGLIVVGGRGVRSSALIGRALERCTGVSGGGVALLGGGGGLRFSSLGAGEGVAACFEVGVALGGSALPLLLCTQVGGATRREAGARSAARRGANTLGQRKSNREGRPDS